MQVEVYSSLTLGRVREKVEDDLTQQNAFGTLARFPSIGVNVDVGLGENTMFETGLNYSARGSKVFESEFKFDYLDIPLNFVIQPKNFRVFFGPQFSILAGSKLDGQDASVAIENTDFGIRYGLGVEKRKYSVRLIFQNGFKDVFRDTRYKWRSNAINIAIGYIVLRKHGGSATTNDPLKGHRERDF